MTFWHYGTITSIYMESESSAWRVGIISRRKMPTNIVTSLSESEFHELLRAKLK